MVMNKRYTQALAVSLLALAVSNIFAGGKDRQSFHPQRGFSWQPGSSSQRKTQARRMSPRDDVRDESGDWWVPDRTSTFDPYYQGRSDSWPTRTDESKKKTAGAIVGKAGKKIVNIAAQKAKDAKDSMSEAWQELTDSKIIQWPWYICSRGALLTPVIGTLGYFLTAEENIPAFKQALKTMMKVCGISGLVSLAGLGSRFLSEINGFSGYISNGIGGTVIVGSAWLADKLRKA